MSGEVSPLAFDVDAKLLERVKEVMATVPPEDSKLVDLYANRGNADPILVATALREIAESEEMLLKDDWVIVSDDKAVRRKAAEFGIPTIGSTQFRDLIGPHKGRVSVDSPARRELEEPTIPTPTGSAESARTQKAERPRRPS